MSDCEICPFLINQTSDDVNVLLQTPYWVAVLDKNQEYLGKLFVTLREHKATISELSSDEWDELREVMARLEKAVMTAFLADVPNWMCLMNNAVAAGQPTHVHWHLHPRYLNGATFAGEHFPDPTWPLRREKIPHMVTDDMFDKIARAIKAEL